MGFHMYVYSVCTRRGHEHKVTKKYEQATNYCIYILLLNVREYVYTHGQRIEHWWVTLNTTFPICSSVSK